MTPKPTLMRNDAAKFIARTPLIKTSRSAFPVNFSRKQTCKASYLYPVFFQEVLPGDTWDINMTHFIRLLPQVTAPMDNLWVKFYGFFSPNRIEWENFPKQMGERENPDDSIDYITPSITFDSSGIPFKSLFDYLGGTRCGIANTKVTAYGGRMYNHIWNDYFRASEIQDSIYTNKTDSDDDPSKFTLQRICKMHDGYFTDSLPSILAGGLNNITLPLGTECPVMGNGMTLGLTDGYVNFGLENLGGQTQLYGAFTEAYGLPVGQENKTIGRQTANITTGVTTDPTKSGLKADLSNAVSSTLTAMRLAIDSMELLERDQRSGNRYQEIMYGRYKTIIPDLQLYRPQLIGSMATPLFTTPVIQTSGTGVSGQNTPQGNIAGMGVTAESGNIIRLSSVEFGHIMVLMAIQAMPQYQQGLDKKYSRYERYDFYHPEFNAMTDQTITEGEIYYQDPTATDSDGNIKNDKPFGYTGRYEELRTFKNEICGELRSEYTTTLDSWHYAEKFENEPVLNSNFIEDKTAEILQRSMAVTSEGEEIAEQFLVDIEFKGSVVRGIPTKAVPRTGGNILG